MELRCVLGLCHVLTAQKWTTQNFPALTRLSVLFWSVCGCYQPVALLARSRMAVAGTVFLRSMWSQHPAGYLGLVQVVAGQVSNTGNTGVQGLLRPGLRRALRHFCLLLLTEASHEAQARDWEMNPLFQQENLHYHTAKTEDTVKSEQLGLLLQSVCHSSLNKLKALVLEAGSLAQ